MRSLLMVILAVPLVVIADDVFFFDHTGNEMIHRLSQACYITFLTADQVENIHNPTTAMEIQELMREHQNDPAKLTRLSHDEASDFVTHHCHDRALYIVAQ